MAYPPHLFQLLQEYPNVATVLGLLLFLACINDLLDCIQHSTIRVFADDYRQIQSELNAILLQDIKSLLVWTIAWQMELNTDKCCSMSVTVSHLHNAYHNIIQQLLTVSTYLGVTMQSDSRKSHWNMHVQQIANNQSKSYAPKKYQLSLNRD